MGIKHLHESSTLVCARPQLVTLPSRPFSSADRTKGGSAAAASRIVPSQDQHRSITPAGAAAPSAATPSTQPHVDSHSVVAVRREPGGLQRWLVKGGAGVEGWGLLGLGPSSLRHAALPTGKATGRMCSRTRPGGAGGVRGGGRVCAWVFFEGARRHTGGSAGRLGIFCRSEQQHERPRAHSTVQGSQTV